MRLVFVMDPLDGVDPDKDTTFGFVEAATARQHECLHCLIQQVEWWEGEPTAFVRSMRLEGRDLRLEGKPWRVRLSEVDAVLVRKDPPFDAAYSHATLLLELLRGKTVVMNDPRGLREANEKLYTLGFSEWMPETIVTSEVPTILEFVRDVGGRGVIKPLDGAGGYGVMVLHEADPNVRAIADFLTGEGARAVMVQAFIPDAAVGDKRVLLLDGESLGAVLRVPSGGDFRANIHVGGDVRPTELTEREQAVVAAVAPRLKKDGLVFVGLDLVGGCLTEINVTSPTGIRELSRFAGRRVSDDVLAWVERAAAAMNG